MNPQGPGYSSSYRITSLILFIVGTLINIFAYGSIEPAFAVLIFIILATFLTRIAAVDERRAFLLIFSICWFWAGISAIYANYFNDPFQNDSDAKNFFELSTGKTVTGLTVNELGAITTGAAAIVTWRYVYDFFAILGFAKERYIGILLNVTLISSTMIIGVKLVKTLFGEDRARIARFIKMFSLCGLFWLFAAIHVRDAAILFTVSFLILLWVRYLQFPGPWKMVYLILATVFGSAVFSLLRREFVFMPLAMLIAGFVSLLISTKKRSARVKILLGMVFILLPVMAYLISTIGFDLFHYLTLGNESYTEKSLSTSDDNSLGTQFISNQPLPIRLIFSVIYLFVFPIPFWFGFQLESAYHLFKSFQVILMYAVTPLFALGVWQVIRQKKLHTPPLLFLLFITIGFILAIAYTSVETRHFGSFLVPVFLLSLVPDISQKKDGQVYQNLLTYFIAIILLGHVAWAVLKLR